MVQQTSAFCLLLTPRQVTEHSWRPWDCLKWHRPRVSFVRSYCLLAFAALFRNWTGHLSLPLICFCITSDGINGFRMVVQSFSLHVEGYRVLRFETILWPKHTVERFSTLKWLVDVLSIASLVGLKGHLNMEEAATPATRVPEVGFVSRLRPLDILRCCYKGMMRTWQGQESSCPGPLKIMGVGAILLTEHCCSSTWRCMCLVSHSRGRTSQVFLGG